MNEGRQGEQNETGAETRNLNDVLAYAWAAVSGTVWKTHSLKSSGLLTAEYKRGPLILWASRPGEGGAVQRSGPVASALEDPVDRLNTAGVFERFRWAARGRVRPSVRWKSSRKKRAQQVARSFLWDRRSGFRLRSGDNIWEEPMSQAVQYPCIAYWAHHPASLLRAFSRRFRARLRCYVAVRKRRLKHMEWLGVSEDPELKYGNSQNGNIETSLFGSMVWGLAKGKMPEASNIMAWVANTRGKCSPIQMLSPLRKTLAGDGISPATFRKLHIYLRSLTHLRINFSVALKHMEQEAYRAHLTRRVKPAPRRHRIRRPLYARPQPPAAPLAPPV